MVRWFLEDKDWRTFRLTDDLKDVVILDNQSCAYRPSCVGARSSTTTAKPDSI